MSIIACFQYNTDSWIDNVTSVNFNNKKDDKILYEGKLFATQALSQTQKNVSEPQMGIEPTTF